MREYILRYGKKEHVIPVPTEWGELSREQLFAVVNNELGLVGDDEFYSAFGFPVHLLPAWIKVQINDTLSFITDLSGKCDHFIIDHVKNMKAPAKHLIGCSFQQFMSIDSFYSYFISTQDEEFLGKMCAATFLLPDEGFVRDKQHTQLVDIAIRTDIFMLDDHKILRNALFLNWILIKNWLSGIYKNLFPKGDVSSNNKPQPADWLSVFDSFVGDNVPFMESYQSMECMDALRILDHKIADAKKLHV